MKKRILFLIMAFVLVPSLRAQEIVKVGNAEDLILAIGSGRKIMLEPGTYNLSEVPNTALKNVRWLNNHDGFEPVISNVRDLELAGDGKATIVIEPRYAWVMNFENCSGLRFSGITFGHTEAGYCQGGVLRFSGCSDVLIESCRLYGSGTYGLEISETSGLRFRKSTIYECTYGLMMISASKSIAFENAVFRNTGEYDLVLINGSQDVSFSKCMFENNFSSKQYWETSETYFFMIDLSYFGGTETSESRNLFLTSCTFMRNSVKLFSNDASRLLMSKNVFAGNAFPEEGLR